MDFFVGKSASLIALIVTISLYSCSGTKKGGGGSVAPAKTGTGTGANTSRNSGGTGTGGGKGTSAGKGPDHDDGADHREGDEEGDPKGTGTGSKTLQYPAKISAIIDKSCGGKSCHGAGAKNGVFVGGPKTFLASNPAASINDGSMPPEGTKTLSSTDKKALLAWIKENSRK